MAVMEFYVSADEVWYASESGMHPLIEGSAVVDAVDERIRELYPKADVALSRCYERSAANARFFRFLRVRRFCKCNFGALDNTRMDVDTGVFNIEAVPCPLRGECPWEGVICLPEMDTRLSEAEVRVMRLLCDGMSNIEIANELFLSPNTVKRHVSTAYVKTRTRNRAEFVRFASDNSIFI